MRAPLAAFLFLIGAAGLRLVLPSASAATPDDPVKAQLVVDGTTLMPGQPFRVGILFRIAPEWHIYWKNPGDAGLATAVTFELPQGFSIGELQWPLPQQFVQPGDVVGYGYAGSVLLFADVTPPARLEVGKDVAIRAKASWLSCRDLCLPGRADLSAKLPVATRRMPANDELFAGWAARMPSPSNALSEVGNVAVAAAPLAPGSDSQVVVTVSWETEVSRVEFFPAPPEGVLVGRPAVTTKQKKTEVVFTARRPGVGAADSVECVVAFTLPDGERKGFPVEVRLPARRAPPARQQEGRSNS